MVQENESAHSEKSYEANLHARLSVSLCKMAMLALIMVAGVFGAFGQSREQRMKANEFKCRFEGYWLASKNSSKHTSDYGIMGSSTTKSKGLDCFYTLRLNSKEKETFTVETYFVAKQDKKTFPFAKDEVEVTLRRGFTTNIVVKSPELTLTTRRILNGRVQIACCTSTYSYKKSEEGAKIIGAIGRLKKDGVIIKTCVMGPCLGGDKMAWQPSIELVKVKDTDSDAALFLGTDPKDETATGKKK